MYPALSEGDEVCMKYDVSDFMLKHGHCLKVVALYQALQSSQAPKGPSRQDLTGRRPSHLLE